MATIFPSNGKTIIRAIAQLLNAVGSHVDGVPQPFLQPPKIWGAPTQTQLENVGTPWASVGRLSLIGYNDGGVLVGPDAAHGVMQYEPVWDTDIYTYHPYDENNPNYDDAFDDAAMMLQLFIAYYQLPFSSVIADTPSPTTSTFAVQPGDGARFTANANYTFFVNGQPVGPIQSISGDIITLAIPLGAPPGIGTVASQATCVNSYPYDVRPDYAQLTSGGPWIVGALTLRVSEVLITQF